MPGLNLQAPFPDNVPTHPLLIVDYDLIQKRDSEEIEKLWEAATKLGFWYLKNHGANEEVDGMFEMGAETMRLPLEEKMKFEQGDDGMSAGYKAAGHKVTDEQGSLDTTEYINVSKDDVLAYPERVHRIYPSTVGARMDSTIKPFVKKSLAINQTLLNVFNEKLGLPEGTLASLHPPEKHSGCEARCIKNPPPPEGVLPEAKVAIGAHTDFGSLSFLHNRLGGLQVLPPGFETWQYVRPIPGCAICNVGDTLSIFSGGILMSSLHRVVPPPGEQIKFERWSLVFFTRPAYSELLRALVDKSPLISEALSKANNPAAYDPNVTAQEWFARRVKNRRIKNRSGPDTWKGSRGMEHKPEAT